MNHRLCKILNIINWALVPRALYCPKATNPSTEWGYICFRFHFYKCRWCEAEGVSKPGKDICWRLNCFLKEKGFAKG